MVRPIPELISSLNQAGVSYIIVGGVAVNAHGFTRNTLDLDLIVPFNVSNVELLVQCMKDSGFATRLPVDPHDLSNPDVRAQWKERHMIVLSFLQDKPPYTAVDIFIEHPIPFETLTANSLEAVIGSDIRAKICGLRDLITLKEQAGRPQDQIDLRWLYAILRKRESNE